MSILERTIDALRKLPHGEVDDLIKELLAQGIVETARGTAPRRPPNAEGLSLWQSHKHVWADKITNCTHQAFDYSFILRAGDAKVRVPEEHFRSHFFKYGDVDMGYLVIYSDGYMSWSPTKAFEEGNTRIEK